MLLPPLRAILARTTLFLYLAAIFPHRVALADPARPFLPPSSISRESQSRALRPISPRYSRRQTPQRVSLTSLTTLDSSSPPLRPADSCKIRYVVLYAPLAGRRANYSVYLDELRYLYNVYKLSVQSYIDATTKSELLAPARQDALFFNQGTNVSARLSGAASRTPLPCLTSRRCVVGLAFEALRNAISGSFAGRRFARCDCSIDHVRVGLPSSSARLSNGCSLVVMSSKYSRFCH
jgi:hypothetical protein